MDKEAMLKECILRNAPMKYVEIEMDDNINLIDDLGYDSVSYIKLIIDLEKTFEFKFKEEALFFENFKYSYFYEQLCC